MGIGAGILITAVGAVLYFAVTADIAGVDIQTIGIILMVAGIVVAVVSAIMMASARSRYGVARTRTVVEDVPPGPRI